MRVTAYCSLFVLVCLLPAFAAEAPVEPSAETIHDDLRAELVAPGVWRHVSYKEVSGFGRVPANGLLVIGEASTALIDTPWNDEQTRSLFDWVEARFGEKIGHVVATHSHGDCMGGLAEAHRRGAMSHALELTAEFARKAESPVPRETFARHHEIPLGGVELELRYFGGGHTRDNIVVWIPQRKVLFGGCLVKRKGGGAGNTAEADIAAWPATLRKVMRAYPDAQVVIPGHGKPGGLDYLEYTAKLAEGLATE